MKLTIIGPWGSYPKTNGASAGYLLEHDGFQLLIDCGSGVLSKLQQYIHPTELDAVVLSHYHADHIADIGVLQHALLVAKYMGESKGNMPIYGHKQDIASFQQLTYKDITTGIAYHENEELVIGPFKMTFSKTIHPVPCYAMKCMADDKTIVYTADTSYSDSLVTFSQHANVLLCEASFYEQMSAQASGHMTSADAGQLAQKAAVQGLILTHLPHFGDIKQLKTEAAKQFSGDIELAKEGLTIDI